MSVFGVILFLIIIYFIFLENDLFFSIKEGPSFIIPSIFKEAVFFYPSYNFFELYPSYSNYMFASQVDPNLSTSFITGVEPQFLPHVTTSFVPMQNTYKYSLAFFINTYSKLASLYFYEETLPFEDSEEMGDYLPSVLPLFPFITEEEALPSLLSFNPVISGFSSSLLVLSSLSCYEGSSIRNSALANIRNCNLSFSFKVSSNFFLNEAFSKDLYLCPLSLDISLNSPLLALYKTLSFNEHVFFKKHVSLFYYYST